MFDYFNLTWTQAKDIINNNSVLYFRKEDESAYNIYIRENEFIIDLCVIKKGTADQTEYDNYYAALEGTKDYYKKWHYFTATAGTSTNLDFKLKNPADQDCTCYLYRGHIKTDNNVVFGDTFDVIIIDIDDILGYGPNFVLANMIKGEPLLTGEQEIKLNPPSADPWNSCKKIPQGIYIRCIYHSTGQNNVNLFIGTEHEY